MIKVFISYSHEDSNLATEISNTLGKLKVNYFLDKKDIEWGANIKQHVDNNLFDSTHLIVIISPASLKSLWVPYEIGNANALGLTILPYLQHPSIDVPEYIRHFKNIKSIDSIKEYFSRKLTNEISGSYNKQSIISILDRQEVDKLYPESVLNVRVWLLMRRC